ncbi:hypothetical protein M3Y98_00174900 [Aphelenchoides besseyi]|nr:hypothetical protein M3Y98_00174900 [Aphelenchoides besseyi]KAI6200043.1 hypothetical protein M3Y96_00691600 [Aphelenchoides besseyi]
MIGTNQRQSFKVSYIESANTSTSLFNRSDVVAYGSMKSGLANAHDSDIDLTILIPTVLALQKQSVFIKLKQNIEECIHHLEYDFESSGQTVVVDFNVNNFKAKHSNARILLKYRFNRFLLVLLLVHYLHSGISSPILPVLNSFRYDNTTSCTKI